MYSSRLSGQPAGGGLLSSSVQIGMRSPVAASTTATGVPGSSDCAMSVIGAAPVLARSTLGTDTRAAWPGEKPSLRLVDRGSGRTPLLLAGSIDVRNATRLPVRAWSSG